VLALAGQLGSQQHVPSAGRRRPPLPPTFTIGSAAFFDEFVTRCHVATPTCTVDDLETIFDFVQSADEHADEAGNGHPSECTPVIMAQSTHPTGALTISEWLEVLVRIAIKRYGKYTSGGDSLSRGRSACDVPIALEQLCREVLMARLPAAPLEGHPAGVPSNHFRRLHCFTTPMSKLLSRRLPLCRALFAAHARRATFTVPDRGDSSSHASSHADSFRSVTSHEGGSFRSADGGEGAIMTLGGWLGFVEEMGLLHEQHLSLPQARGVFLCSRLRTCPAPVHEPPRDIGAKEHGLTLRCHLDFTDWLEALVRLSSTLSPHIVPAAPMMGRLAEAYDLLTELHQLTQCREPS